MNDILTAYLYGLYAARGGRLAPADAMAHVLDMMTAARRSKAAIEDLIGLKGRPEDSTGSSEGDLHA